MSDVDQAGHEDLDLLAAEYVMAVVSIEEQKRIEALIRSEPALAGLVASWRRRLGPLDQTAAEGHVSEDLWSRIDKTIGQETAAAAPSIRRGTVEAPSRWSVLWESLAFWRVTGLSALAAALVLAIGTGYFAIEASRQPVLVAVLMTDQNEAAAVVNAFADGRAELRALKFFEIPAGRAIEIWTLWDRSVGPKSIGLIRSVSGKVSLRLDGLPKPAPGQLFEMTLEPATGSPIGRPTGPVLNKGNAAVAL
jgi:anti-sigma-K factor RskA